MKNALKNPYLFLFLITIVGFLSAGFHVTRLPVYIVYSDIKMFYTTATAPGIPYISKLIEYAVIIGLFIHLMGVLSRDFAGYYILSSLFLILFAIIATYFLFLTVEKEDKKRLLIYWVFAPSMFFFLIYNWDIIPLLFVVVALYAIKQEKNYLAALLFALGFSSKLFPVIYLLPLLIKNNKVIEWIKILGIFILTTVMINGFFILSNFDGWFYIFSLQSQRPPNRDSIWWIIRNFIQLSVSQINIIVAVFFISSSLMLMWKFRHESTIKLCLIMTLNSLIFTKVFSPQHLLWLLPFFVLVPLINKKSFYMLEIANLIVVFGLNYYAFSHEVIFLYGYSFFVIFRLIVLIFILMKTLDADSTLKEFFLKLK